MLRLSLTYPSRALFTPVRLEIGLPGGLLAANPPWKVVWALHPAMADGSIFFEALNCGELVEKYGFAIIAPSLGNGYFVNSTYQRQADFLYEIKDYLPDILPLKRAREANTVLGISMGGFGAVHWGLKTADFVNVIAISGVFDPELAPDERIFKNRTLKALFKGLHRIMLERLLTEAGHARREDNIQELIKYNEKEKPAIYLYCGEEDYLSLNQTMHLEEMCKANGVHCNIEFTPGGHEADYWRKAFSSAINSIMK